MAKRPSEEGFRGIMAMTSFIFDSLATPEHGLARSADEILVRMHLILRCSFLPCHFNFIFFVRTRFAPDSGRSTIRSLLLLSANG